MVLKSETMVLLKVSFLSELFTFLILETGLTKRAQSVSSLRTTDIAFLGKIPPRSSSSWNNRQKIPIKEFGTQTDSSGTQIVSV
jgi:hypothetical protein